VNDVVYLQVRKHIFGSLPGLFAGYQ